VNEICDNTINQDGFSSDEHQNFFANNKYISLCPLFSRLFDILATSSSVERVFSHTVQEFEMSYCNCMLVVHVQSNRLEVTSFIN